MLNTKPVNDDEVTTAETSATDREATKEIETLKRKCNGIASRFFKTIRELGLELDKRTISKAELQEE